MNNSPYGIIYRFTNRTTQKSYIGYTVEGLQERKQRHVNLAKHGSSFLFHRSIRKYGIDHFEYEILASSWDLKNLLALEVLLIAQEQTLFPNGYNMTIGGEHNNRLGSHHTPEAKKKISEAASGRICSPETKIKHSLALKGKKNSPIHCERIGAAKKRYHLEKHGITYNGETLTIPDWAKRIQVTRGTLNRRLNKGLDLEKALTTPSRKAKK